MAVTDLWVGRDGKPTKRHGRGLRWRVTAPGYPATSHRTRAEAQHVHAQRVAAGPRPPSDGATVGDLVEVWLAGKRGLSPKGYEAAQLAAAHVLEHWRWTLVDDVTQPDAQAWLAGLSTPRGPASASLRAKVGQCLSGALRGRVELHLVAGRQVRHEPVYLDAARLRELADACTRYESLVLLLGATGLRVGEALALDVGDVDVVRGRLRVRRSKSGRGRDVPVPASVLGLLDLDRAASAPLFTTPSGSRVNKGNWRSRHWRPATEAVGLAGLRVHDLRHTAASLAIASGADPKMVQSMLGHASAAMTLDIYASLWERGLDDVATRMDRLLEK